MPNWCNNDLAVTGPDKTIKEFNEKFKGKGTNWGLSDYEIYGKTVQEVADLVAKQKEEYEKAEPTYHFDALYPVPQEVIEIGYSYSPPKETIQSRLEDLFDQDKWIDGYSWCISHWGTKWDPSDIECIDDSIYIFDTAWAPPCKWVEKVSADFPDLKFTLTYVEEGMCFAGKEIYKAGKMLGEETSVDYSKNKKEYREFVKEHFCYDPMEGDEDE